MKSRHVGFNGGQKRLCQQLPTDSSQLPTSALQTAEIIGGVSPGMPPPLPGFLKARVSFPWCLVPQSFTASFEFSVGKLFLFEISAGIFCTLPHTIQASKSVNSVSKIVHAIVTGHIKPKARAQEDFGFFLIGLNILLTPLQVFALAIFDLCISPTSPKHRFLFQ